MIAVVPCLNANPVVEVLTTTALLLNNEHYTSTSGRSPHELLLGITPDYSVLRLFGCLYYPNSSSNSQHKLDRWSLTYFFLGYPPDHRGYRCYDPTTLQVLTSRHIRFDKHQFPLIVDRPTKGH